MDDPAPLLLAVPNLSEGRDRTAIDALASAFAPPGDPARLLDVHADADHGRSVYTLAGRQGELAPALLRGAREAIGRIDLRRHSGAHPHVGAIDVAPIVYLEPGARGAACAEALTAGALIGEALELPVLLYGELASVPDNRERASLRSGGTEALARRLADGTLMPDYGPSRPHPSGGALLVTARPPLVAFNLELASATVEHARSIAARLRESGGGLRGVRAIGVALAQTGRAQVSTNVHDHRATSLRSLVEAVAAEAEIAEAELVGLAPRAALEDFPPEVPLRGFDPERHVIERAIENALRSGG